jgi:putative tricarboxylic transport membrane protein
MSNPDPMQFFTRPISLFFIILAAISLVFPFWQQYRHLPWTRYFLPASLVAVSLPFWISPGVMKLVGLLFLVVGLYLLYRRTQTEEAVIS